MGSINVGWVSAQRVTQQIAITIIRIYRYAFSLLLGHCCRFEPSCSAYAIEAINVHGCLKGCYYALRRVLRCHPWHAGGVDPIPSNHINQRKRC